MPKKQERSRSARFACDFLKTLTPEKSSDRHEKAFDGPENLGEDPDKDDRKNDQNSGDDHRSENGKNGAAEGDTILDK